MFSLELICSDDACELTIEVVDLDIERLEALVCDDCDCCLQVVSVSYAEAARLPGRTSVALALAA